MPQPHNLEIGFVGERIAAEFYKAKGFRIIALNFFNRRGKPLGEIDFIAGRGNHIHFVEVKSRVANSAELDLHEVNQPKRLKLLMAIRYFWLLNQGYLECE